MAELREALEDAITQAETAEESAAPVTVETSPEPVVEGVGDASKPSVDEGRASTARTNCPISIS